MSFITLLTIRQPWASLVVHGHKPVENRVWRTNYRGVLYIHAGTKPHGVKAEEIERKFNVVIKRPLLYRGIIGRVNLVDVVRNHNSPWFEGPYGWVLEAAEPLPFIPLPGRLMLFQLPLSSLSAEARSIIGPTY
jgi:hypothetical protein